MPERWYVRPGRLWAARHFRLDILTLHNALWLMPGWESEAR